MAKYKTCEFCGANLDFNEPCNCPDSIRGYSLDDCPKRITRLEDIIARKKRKRKPKK